MDLVKKNASMIWFSVRVRRNGFGLYGVPRRLAPDRKKGVGRGRAEGRRWVEWVMLTDCRMVVKPLSRPL